MVGGLPWPSGSVQRCRIRVPLAAQGILGMRACRVALGAQRQLVGSFGEEILVELVHEASLYRPRTGGLAFGSGLAFAAIADVGHGRVAARSKGYEVASSRPKCSAKYIRECT